MGSNTRVEAGWAGAVYDVAVTAAFATPWTAAFVLGLFTDVHDALGLGGTDVPTFETEHLLYVTLFGVVVTMWGVVRVLRPIPFLIAVDTVGRGAFALWFTWALLAGHSTIVVAFLVLELVWLVLQGRGVRRALAAEAAAAGTPARAPAQRQARTATTSGGTVTSVQRSN
jgi:hypothetical protein